MAGQASSLEKELCHILQELNVGVMIELGFPAAE